MRHFTLTREETAALIERLTAAGVGAAEIRRYARVSQAVVGSIRSDRGSDPHRSPDLAPVPQGVIRDRIEAGLQPITLHEARHSAASYLIEAGLNDLELTKMIGHTDPRTTKTIYGHLFPDSSEKVAAKLDAYLDAAVGDPLTVAKGSRGVGSGSLPMRRPSRYLTCLLPILIALLLVGCGGSEQTATSATTPAVQQQERVEAAFRHKLQKQFNEGANEGHVHEVAEACHDEGVGQGGDENVRCEGWGVANNGNCFLVTTEATINSFPGTLERVELTPGVGPFEPGSCKIGGK